MVLPAPPPGAAGLPGFGLLGFGGKIGAGVAGPGVFGGLAPPGAWWSFGLAGELLGGLLCGILGLRGVLGVLGFFGEFGAGFFGICRSG